MKSCSEPLEQRELRTIPNRIARRVGPDREIQADDGTHSAKKLEVRGHDLTTLEATNSCVRRADRPSDLGLAQAGSDPGKPHICSHSTDRLPQSSFSSISYPLSTNHVLGWCQPALHWQSSRTRGTLSVRTIERASCKQLSDRAAALNRTPSERIGVGMCGLWPDRGRCRFVGTLSVHRGVGTGR